jgi:hypothetical protein
MAKESGHCQERSDETIPEIASLALAMTIYRMSPQARHQSSQKIQTLYKTKGKEKRKTISLSNLSTPQTPQKNPAYR